MNDQTKRDPSRRRRRVIIAGTIMLVLFAGGTANVLAEHEGALRPVDLVRISGLMALAIVLALRSTTSLRFTSRNPELDDELTRANRASAALVGFWMTMSATALAFVGAVNGLVTLVEVAPYILIVGAISAGVRFTMLEARGE